MNTFSNGQIGANGDMDQGWVSWTGVGLVALGSTLLWASKAADARSSIITGLSCIEDLVDLEKMRHLMPLLLAVRAKVGSKSPIYNRESKACVISTVVEEEIWRKEKENGRLSHEPFQTAVNRSVSPSWHLETDKGSSPVVVVEGAEHAEGLLGVMAVSQTFKAEDDSKQSLARLILDKAWRMSKTGTRTTEHYLALGSTVTLIGEIDQPAVLGSSYRMRKPANPRYPFVISTLTLPQLDLQAKRVAQVLKIASWSLIGIGGALVATRFVRSFWRRYKEARARQDFVRSKKEIEERKRAHLQLTASRSGAEGGGQEDIDIEKLAGFCVVCFERESDCVFSGCGHLCCCSNCSIKIGRKCPICRVHSNSLKVFKS